MRKIISAAAALALCVNIGAGPILAAGNAGQTELGDSLTPSVQFSSSTPSLDPSSLDPLPRPPSNVPIVERSPSNNVIIEGQTGPDENRIVVKVTPWDGRPDVLVSQKVPGGNRIVVKVTPWDGNPDVLMPQNVPGGFGKDTDEPGEATGKPVKITIEGKPTSVEVTAKPANVTIEAKPANVTIEARPKKVKEVTIEAKPEQITVEKVIGEPGTKEVTIEARPKKVTIEKVIGEPGTNESKANGAGANEAGANGAGKDTNLTRDLPGMKGLQLSPDGGEQTGEEPGTLQLNIFQTGEESVLQLPDGELYPIDADVPVKLSGLFDSVAVEGGFPIGIGRDAQIGYLSGQGANLRIQGTVENAEFGKKTTVRLLDGANVQNAILKYCKLTAQKGSTLGNMFGQSANAILNVQDGANLGSATMSKPGFVTGVPPLKLVGDTVQEATESKDSGSGGGNNNSGSGGNNNSGSNPTPTPTPNPNPNPQPTPPPTPQPTGAEQALTDLFTKIEGNNSTPGVKLGKGSVTGTEAIANGTLTISFESGWADKYQTSGSDGIQIAGTEPFTYTDNGITKTHANFVLNVDEKAVDISILTRTSESAGTPSQLWNILNGSGIDKPITVTGSDNKQYTVTFKPVGDGSSVTVNVSAEPK